MQIKLRRSWDGQDSYGAYLEEVALDTHGHLAYRQSTGGNCSYGSWKEWESEARALEFLLGPVGGLLDDAGILAAFRGTFKQLPDIEPVNHFPFVNYGSY